MPVATARGDVRNTTQHRLAKQYAFSVLSRVMPGKISPTDVDGRYYVERHDQFLWWEFKMEEPPLPAVEDCIPWAQLKPLKTLLTRGRPGDVGFVCVHPDLERVVVDSDLHAFALLKWDQPCLTSDGTVHTTNWRPSGEMKYWVDNWFKHLDGDPNHFMTNFRKATGVYPGDVSWE
jgi:hypothetical protein